MFILQTFHYKSNERCSFGIRACSLVILYPNVPVTSDKLISSNIYLPFCTCGSKFSNGNLNNKVSWVGVYSLYRLRVRKTIDFGFVDKVNIRSNQ